MKRIVETVETNDDGLEALLGENVEIWCLNYIYAGKLIGVNCSDIILEDAVVVYETGELGAKEFKDAQKLNPKEWRIRTRTIESYGKTIKV